MATITFVIDDRLLTVCYEEAYHSWYIKNLPMTEDITVLIPNKFHTNIYNYVSFLNGEEPIINDEKVLIDCFDIESYFEHKEYFDYLVECVVKNYSLFELVIREKIRKEIQKEIYLVCPYTLLPESYRQDKVFLNSWIEESKNNKYCTVELKYYQPDEELREISIQEGKKKVEILLYPDGGRCCESLWFEGSFQEERNWYKNGNIRHWHILYIKEINQAGVTCRRHHWRRYYESGRLYKEGEYEDNEMVGIWITYYDTEESSDKEAIKYRDDYGYEDGYYSTEYYPSGQVKSEGKYNRYGERIDIWTWYFESGEVMYQYKFMAKSNRFWSNIEETPWDDNDIP